MKSVVKILLIVLTPLLMFLCALSINIKGQLLFSRFWTNTFRDNEIYQKISVTIGDKVVDKVMDSGGQKTDIKDLSGFISESSIRSFSEKNIEGIIEYVNGKSDELNVYAPILSEGILNIEKVANIDSYSKEVQIDTFLSEYNVSGINSEDFKYISRFGIYSWFLLILSYSLLILNIFFLLHLTNEGRKFVLPGISFIFSGLTFLGMYFIGNSILKMLSLKYFESTNIGTLLITIITPPIVSKIIQIWIWFSVSSLIIGVILFFIKKPVKTKQK